MSDQENEDNEKPFPKDSQVEENNVNEEKNDEDNNFPEEQNNESGNEQKNNKSDIDNDFDAYMNNINNSDNENNNKENENLNEEELLLPINPSNIPFSESKIISTTEAHKIKELRLLKTWLVQTLNSDFTTKLIFSSENSDDKAVSFHQKCDNIAPTLTLIETKEGFRYGGFTSQFWESSEQSIFKKEKNAFYQWPSSYDINEKDELTFGQEHNINISKYEVYEIILINDENENNENDYNENVEDKEEKNANSDIKELAPRKIDEDEK